MAQSPTPSYQSGESSEFPHPRGILKNPPNPEAYHLSPPPVDHELVLQNTRTNAAQHSDHSNIRHAAVAAVESANGDAESSARLKWDEANIYLTEQERSATMKITEPKTPYAHSVDPIDLDDEEFDDLEDSSNIILNGVNGNRGRRDDVPGLDLGEPEEPVPVPRFSSAIIVSDEGEQRINLDEEPMTPEQEENEDEEEKHRRFEEMRKKHYEMKDALRLAHQLQAENDEILSDDDDE